MAQVQMRAWISGTRDGQDWPRVGETLTCSDAEAADLVAQGLAVPVKSAPEAAAAPAPETAAKPKPARRARK